LVIVSFLDCGGVDAQVDSTLPFDQRDDPIETRSFGCLVSAEAKDDAADILVGDAQTSQSEQNDHDQDDCGPKRHGSLLL